MEYVRTSKEDKATNSQAIASLAKKVKVGITYNLARWGNRQKA